MIYVLALIISVCLASAQGLWGSVVKKIVHDNPQVGNVSLIIGVFSSSKFWIGTVLYGVSTVLYFLLLSRAKFFGVQMTMTGVAIVSAILISHFFFKESISVINATGIVCIIIGIILVTK